MPTIIDRLLGERPRTAENLLKEIDTNVIAITVAERRREEAFAARKVAIEAFDDVGHLKADGAIAAAVREIERREHALAALRSAYEMQVEIEARETFRRDAKNAKRTESERTARLKREYPSAAETIARLMTEAAEASYTREQLRRTARKLGEPMPEYDVFADGLHIAVGDLPSLGSASFIHQGMAEHYRR